MEYGNEKGGKKGREGRLGEGKWKEKEIAGIEGKVLQGQDEKENNKDRGERKGRIKERNARKQKRY